MKKYIVLILIQFILFIDFINAQDCSIGNIPKEMVKNGITYWYGVPVNDIMSNTDLIFEGRILTDSAYIQNPPGDVRTYHKVLVLKQFNGIFKSDTINIVSWGGRVTINGQTEGTPGAYAYKGDEAVIFATLMKLGNNNPDLYYILYGDQCGFKKVCDKKDVAKEVYEPIEKAIGHPYIEIHPNNCKGQQQIQQK